MAVRSLIFDVGDVLLGYRWREMFTEHGISPEDTERIAKEMFEADTGKQNNGDVSCPHY